MLCSDRFKLVLYLVYKEQTAVLGGVPMPVLVGAGNAALWLPHSETMRLTLVTILTSHYLIDSYQIVLTLGGTGLKGHHTMSMSFSTLELGF